MPQQRVPYTRPTRRDPIFVPNPQKRGGDSPLIIRWTKRACLLHNAEDRNRNCVASRLQRGTENKCRMCCSRNSEPAPEKIEFPRDGRHFAVRQSGSELKRANECRLIVGGRERGDVEEQGLKAMEKLLRKTQSFRDCSIPFLSYARLEPSFKHSRSGFAAGDLASLQLCDHNGPHATVAGGGTSRP